MMGLSFSLMIGTRMFSGVWRLDTNIAWVLSGAKLSVYVMPKENICSGVSFVFDRSYDEREWAVISKRLGDELQDISKEYFLKTMADDYLVAHGLGRGIHRTCDH